MLHTRLTVKSVLLCLLVALIFLSSAPAAERYVATNGLSVSPFINWANAATNIQDAVNACSPDDVVWVTNGTYYCGSNSAVAGYTSMVTVINPITIQSVNGPEVTIVDANYPNFTNRCFYISNAAISGFTITNGHACDDNSGGGVFIKTSGRVSNCWITGNSTTNGITGTYSGGGGVRCDSGGDVLNCKIYNNSGGGAGIYVGSLAGSYAGNHIVRDSVISNNSGSCGIALSFSSAFITNCTIANHQAGGMILGAGNAGATVDTCRIVGNTKSSDGGGVLQSYGIMRNCQIYNNSISSGRGGGVYIYGGILSDCLVSSNYTAQDGGGVVINSGALVQNCTIVSNRTLASNIGGGVLIYTGGGTLRNCMVASNYGWAGGIYISVSASKTGVVENCTIAGNAGAVYGGIYKDGAGIGTLVNTICYSNIGANWGVGAGSLVASNCCIIPTTNNTTFTGSVIITNSPLFVDYAGKNYRVTRDSPCVNAGLNQSWMNGAFDLDRHSRVDRYSGVVDMGCYEYLPSGTIFGVR